MRMKKISQRNELRFFFPFNYIKLNLIRIWNFYLDGKHASIWC